MVHEFILDKAKREERKAKREQKTVLLQMATAVVDTQKSTQGSTLTTQDTLQVDLDLITFNLDKPVLGSQIIQAAEGLANLGKLFSRIKNRKKQSSFLKKQLPEPKFNQPSKSFVETTVKINQARI